MSQIIYQDLVIAGSWNTTVFSPKWLNENLWNLPLDTPIPTQLNFHNDRFVSKVYNLGNIKMDISDKKISFNIIKEDPEDFEKVLDWAKRIINLLPQTPIAEIGYNIKTIEEVLVKIPEINFKGYTVDDYKDTYTFVKPDTTDQKLQPKIIVTTTILENSIEFNINFGFKVSSLSESKQVLGAGSFILYQQYSKEVISAMLERYHE